MRRRGFLKLGRALAIGSFIAPLRCDNGGKVIYNESLLTLLAGFSPALPEFGFAE